MKGIASAIRFSVVALIGAMMLVSQAQAGVSCHKINAKGIGQDNGNFTTTANINGGGLLNGTTAAAFTPTGQLGSVVMFEGTVVVTTKQATLTAFVTGGVDLATGKFTSSGPLGDGTGKLFGATGELILTGVEDLSTGRFEETITGSVCVDLSP